MIEQTKQTELELPEDQANEPAAAQDDPCSYDPSDEPDLETLMAWEAEGGCEAVDGCWVEPDGVCEHGCESWLLVLGLI